MVLSKEDGVQNDEIINLSTDSESTRVGDIGSPSIETPKKGISELQVPHLGMEFKTVDDAKNFYMEYGRQEGFCTRTQTTDRKQHSSVMITSCLFVCSREGIHNKKEITLVGISGKPKNTSTVRCQCQASMRVIERKFEDIYEVTVVENTHNHGLVSPCKRMNMRVNKCMPEGVKKLTMVFHDESLPVAKVASVFCGDTIGFTAKDCPNHFGATRKKPKEGDAAAVLHYFEKLSAEDSQFYYAIESDPKGRAVNFFWVDGRSRMQYENFGDVVSFDTTYRTNAYEMPFAPFTGVNHHLMSIQFGCGLLLDETEETFVWLFKTWLAAMGGRPPTSMITDQDKAMTAAVAKVFPNTHHRHCLWHITNKFPEKLAHVMHTNEIFTEELKLIILGSYRIDDFEKKWNEHMLKYKLQDHNWLKGIYDARKKWVPAYHLDTFFAGMNTTGRSESMNSYYDMVLKPSTTLTEFVYSIDKLLALIAKNERDFDYRTEHSSRVVSKNDFLLKHAGKVYTVNIFGKFKSQWDKAKGVYKIDKEEVGDKGFNIYTLKSRNASNPSFWKVNFNTTTFQGDYECKYFSFMGIPCCHILKVFLRHDIDEISDHFILKRWTQKSNTYRAMFEGGLVDGHETSESLRVAHSCRLATQLAFDASTDDDTYRFFVEKFNELSTEIAKRKETLNKSVSSEVLASTQDCEEPSLVDPSQVLLLNPNISLTKGRPKENKANSTRLKCSIEISQEKKGRLCSSCKKVVKHDSRTCPMNPNRKKKAKCVNDDQCSEKF